VTEHEATRQAPQEPRTEALGRRKRLLAAAGDGVGARLRYHESLALAAETGMRFYDAETMRRAAQLAPTRGQAVLELRAAFDLARSQRARPFELRIALDLHELAGR